MRALIKLQRLGYELKVKGEDIRFTWNGPGYPDASKVRSLLDELKANKEAALAYLRRVEESRKHSQQERGISLKDVLEAFPGSEIIEVRASGDETPWGKKALAQKAGSGKWGGVVVVLIAGLLSPMPNFYVNWGRYTQLAGQVILPGVIFLIWEALEGERLNWRLVSLTWIALTGLGLTHYRVLIFAVIFFVAILLMNIRKRKAKQLLLTSILIGLGAGLLFLPWFIHTFEGRIMTDFIDRLTTPANSVSDWTRQYNLIGDLSSYLPTVIWCLFVITVGWIILKKKRGGIIILLWWFLILLITNPQWLQLPGEGAISNFAYFIAIYIPVAIVLGIVFNRLVINLASMWQKLISLLIISLVIWGIIIRLNDIDYENHTLVTRPDLHATQWIQENTDESAKFLIHSFSAYDDTVIVGSDGGWWIPILANRSITVPPINYDSEKGPFLDYRLWVNELISELLSKGIEHPSVLAMLSERNITHIYIGQLNGRVNYNGPNPLPIDNLLNSDRFRLIYQTDQVRIFEIIENN